MSVIVSHIAFSTLAALVQVSQVQFDTQAQVADVRVSWAQFDAHVLVQPPVIVPSTGGGGGPAYLVFNVPQHPEVDHHKLKMIAMRRAEEDVALQIIIAAVTQEMLE
ncbi:MAG: hypothetical protein A2V79_09125 [Betaproteobacteria bacterium RBG_16_56_24]|nr:MAG: hypothetical protein A2V79_09125 [Betaproteobacteria bacterium RBG_16_56_24]